MNIVDGRPRTISYTTDINLQIMSRVERSSGSSNNPIELYYYFNGVQVGDIGNDGPSQTDYAAAIAARGQAAPTGPFKSGSAVNYADFSQGYSPLTPTNSSRTASSVQSLVGAKAL